MGVELHDWNWSPYESHKGTCLPAMLSAMWIQERLEYFSPEPNHADTLIWDFQPPEVRIHSCCLEATQSMVVCYRGPNGLRQYLLTSSFKWYTCSFISMIFFKTPKPLAYIVLLLTDSPFSCSMSLLPMTVSYPPHNTLWLNQFSGPPLWYQWKENKTSKKKTKPIQDSS